MRHDIREDEHCQSCDRVLHWKNRVVPTCHYCEKTIAKIKQLVDGGVPVYWKQDNYEVFHRNEQWSIVCSNNDSCIGLTSLTGDKLNGHPDDFYYIDSISKARVPVSFINHAPWDGLPESPQARRITNEEFNEQYLLTPKPERKQVGGTHYGVMGMEPIQFCMANRWDNCAFSALKYLSRYKRKGGIEDLDKAADFIMLRDIHGEAVHKEMVRDYILIHYYIDSNGFTGKQATTIFQLYAWARGRQSSQTMLELIKELKQELQAE